MATPSSNGGAPIDSYTIQIVKGWTVYYAATASAGALTDFLPVGSYGSYKIRIAAHNAAGWGQWCTDYVSVNP